MPVEVALTAVEAQFVGRHFVRCNNKNFGHQERRIAGVGMARIGKVVVRDVVVRKRDVVSEVSYPQ